jgi:hypothetical protein
MAERSGVEIDYCPKCRGVWLDRGELDKIIELSGRRYSAGGYEHERDDYEDRSRERHHSQRRYEDDYSYRRKKRGSWFAELFEFDD